MEEGNLFMAFALGWVALGVAFAIFIAIGSLLNVWPP